MTTNKKSEDIGALIKQLRKAAGMSQMKLAELLDVTYQQVQKYEKGKSQLTVKRLLQFSEALGVPASTFFPDDGAAPSGDGNGYDYAEERLLLMLFRRLDEQHLRDGVIEMLKTLGKMS